MIEHTVGRPHFLTRQEDIPHDKPIEWGKPLAGLCGPSLEYRLSALAVSSTVHPDWEPKFGPWSDAGNCVGYERHESGPEHLPCTLRAHHEGPCKFGPLLDEKLDEKLDELAAGAKPGPAREAVEAVALRMAKAARGNGQFVVPGTTSDGSGPPKDWKPFVDQPCHLEHKTVPGACPLRCPLQAGHSGRCKLELFTATNNAVVNTTQQAESRRALADCVSLTATDDEKGAARAYLRGEVP